MGIFAKRKLGGEAKPPLKLLFKKKRLLFNHASCGCLLSPANESLKTHPSVCITQKFLASWEVFLGVLFVGLFFCSKPSISNSTLSFCPHPCLALLCPWSREMIFQVFLISAISHLLRHCAGNLR